MPCGCNTGTFQQVCADFSALYNLSPQTTWTTACRDVYSCTYLPVLATDMLFVKPATLCTSDNSAASCHVLIRGIIPIHQGAIWFHQFSWNICWCSTTRCNRKSGILDKQTACTSSGSTLVKTNSLLHSHFTNTKYVLVSTLCTYMMYISLADLSIACDVKEL